MNAGVADGPRDLRSVEPKSEFYTTDVERAKARALIVKTCPGDPADVLDALFGRAL